MLRKKKTKDKKEKATGLREFTGLVSRRADEVL